VIARQLARGGVLLAVALCAALAAGCNGGARIELVALDYRTVDPPPPKSVALHFDACYWDETDSGAVQLVLTHERGSLLGRYGRLDFQLLFQLDKLPAGRERLDHLRRDDMLGVARSALVQARYRSLVGVVSLERASATMLRGSFRALVRRRSTQLLGGWGRPQSVLLQGTFSAIRAAERVAVVRAAILADAEQASKAKRSRRNEQPDDAD
jgi:hypothetical protein